MIKRFLPLIGVLGLAAILGFFIKDFVRVVIVEPLLQVFWLVSLFLQSLPQFLFWMLFVLVALIIAVRSLGRGKRVDEPVRRQGGPPGGPVAVWSRLIQHAEAGGYSKWQLSQSLAKLSWALLGDGERLSAQQIDARIKAGQFDLPPEISAYFQAGMMPYQPVSKLKSRLSLRKSSTPLDLNPEQVIRFLEDELNPLKGHE